MSNKLGKFADFDLDNDGNQCVIIYENQAGFFGMQCFHYLNEIGEEERAAILSRSGEDPEFPFFSGIDPIVGEKYLTFAGWRIAFGPFRDWNHVAEQLQSQGYEVFYSNKWMAVQS